MNESNERRRDFEQQLGDRLKAITTGIIPSATLAENVSRHAARNARRAKFLRIASVAVVSVAGISTLVWARSGTQHSSVAASVPTDVASVPSDQIAPATLNSFPVPDSKTSNFLIVGVDNNACPDADSASAGSFGDRSLAGQRTDTIMVVRVDPATGRAAILSFPRDLWVVISGTNTKGRINSAFHPNDPSRLIATIFDNFGIGIDHFIQVDFCGFKKIVNAVGGVSIPFEYAARDTKTGLDIPNVGCHTFNGDEALAYVRSRHYEYLDPTTGQWNSDPAADFGRIDRQQDFLHRLLSTVIHRSGFGPSAALELVKGLQPSIVVDANLTINTMLQFVGVLSHVDEGSIASYRIDGTPTVISGNSVLTPHLDDPNTRATVSIFGGQQALAATSTTVDPTTGTVGRETTPPIPGPAAGHNLAEIVPPAGVVC
jgi:LCP family protein required for cell wall assembly